MILKIFKAVWFLSLLVISVIFLYVYASLPEQIIVHEGERAFTLSREGVFYLSLSFFATFNVLVFIVSRLYSTSPDNFLCWFCGLIICLNIFFIVSLNFVNLYNSSENFDYSRIGYIIYGSLWLVIAWAISWPVYFVFQKIIAKRPV